MTLPAIVPIGYSGTTTDFLHTKVDRSGAIREFPLNVSVPSGTVVGTYVGLMPFNYGFNLNDLYVNFAALGTSVTCNIGYIYSDNVTYTNKLTAFISASTTPAAGGTISSATTADLGTWRAAADGWIVVDIEGATTGSTGVISYNLSGAYDMSPLTN